MQKKGEVLAALIVLAIAVLYFVARPYFMTPEKEEAYLEVVYFDDHVTYRLNENGTVTVEIWIENTGDAPARNITCFVRARNQDGITLFNDTVNICKFLRVNETCTGYYMFDLMKNDTLVYHTIEITWDGGRSVKSERTLIS